MVFTIIMSSILGICTSIYVIGVDHMKDIWKKKHNKRDGFMALMLVLAIVSITSMLYKRYGLTHQFITLTWCTWLLISMSVYDMKYRQVPVDALVLGGVLGLMMLYLNPNVSLLDALIGSVGVGGGLALLSYFTKGALGMGDALVISVIGLHLGYRMALAVTLYGTVFSGIVGLTILVLRLANRKTKMPMIPFLLGAFICLVCL